MTVDDFLKEWHSEEPFVVAHTSGSTGKPKEIKLLKADMRASAALTNRFFSIDSGSTLLLCLSPDYIAGKMMIVRAEEAGATLLVESPSNRPLEHFSGATVDLLAVVPSQALWLAEHQESLNNVRNMIVGGGEITPRLRTMLSQLHVNAYATYGMTETCSHVALSRIAEPAQPFEALPPVKFATDHRGCLAINAPQFSFKHLQTNDIVDLLAPDRFYWRGRYDNVVNTGGIKVFPEELERKISHLFTRRFYISSRPSDKWGQELVLKIEGAPLSPADEASLKNSLADILTPHQRPKAIIAIPHFAETSSGKVKRQ